MSTQQLIFDSYQDRFGEFPVTIVGATDEMLAKIEAKLREALDRDSKLTDTEIAELRPNVPSGVFI